MPSSPSHPQCSINSKPATRDTPRFPHSLSRLQNLFINLSHYKAINHSQLVRARMRQKLACTASHGQAAFSRGEATPKVVIVAPQEMPFHLSFAAAASSSSQPLGGIKRDNVVVLEAAMAPEDRARAPGPKEEGKESTRWRQDL